MKSMFNSPLFIFALIFIFMLTAGMYSSGRVLDRKEKEGYLEKP